MPDDEAQQSQSSEPGQPQTPTADPVVSTSDPAASVPPAANDEPLKAEEPAATQENPQVQEQVSVPLESEPVVETPAVAEQPTPVIEVEQEKPVEAIPEPLVERAQTEQRPIETPVQQEKRIVERIIEKEKPLTPEDKHAIFKEELKGHLSEANKTKHEHYERHLREIVDFIRSKATLVSNQEIEDGLKIPDSTVTYRLDELIRRGKIIRIGEGFSAKYRLTEGV